MEQRNLLAANPVITEFLASNNNGLVDGDGNRPDWIEIQNIGDMSVDLLGYHLTDDQNDLTRWQFPSVMLDPGEFLVVFASSQPTSNYIDAGGNLHTNFALSVNGEYAALIAPDGNTVVSQLAPDGSNFPQQFPDISYGQSIDGSSVGYFLTPSPGAPNQQDPVSDPNRRVLINEIMYHPTGTSDLDEYIEITNSGANAIDLAGWQLDDGVDFDFHNYVLNPGEFLVVAADLARFAANYPGVANVVGGWSGHLSNNSERIRLVDDVGRLVDQVTYADEGDWAVRARGPLDHGHMGWVWLDDHDGGGKSLELVDLSLSNDYGQNWKASVPIGGTPGAANSVAAADIAPLILDAMHGPAIPRSTDTVTVTARLLDELSTSLSSTLFWRVDGAPSFTPVSMLDNGVGTDKYAGDGVFSAAIPPQPNGTVVEFYLSASDSTAHSRTWPAATFGSGQVTNLLYQVDDSFDPNAPWSPAADPTVRLIMTEAERAELADIGDTSNDGMSESDSDAQMNGTFVHQDGTSLDVRYNVGIRNRGHGTRDNPPNNYRVNLPSDQPWEGVTSLNINSKYTFLQTVGSAIFNLAGVTAANVNSLQLRVNGANLAETGNRMYGKYAMLEEVSSEFADNHYVPDSNGNLYAARRPASNMPSDLHYLGSDPNAYRPYYSKQSNEAADDWSDLIHLTDVLTNAPSATFFAEVSQVANVEQWVRYLALEGLLNNGETSLGRGIGDDYDLYRGVNDPRFVIMPHDLDTILGKGDTVPAIDRSIMLPASVMGLSKFLNDPTILAMYHQAFRELIDSVFNLTTLSPLLHQLLDGWMPPADIAQIETFITDRTAAVLAQLPTTPTQLAGGTLSGNKTLDLNGSPWQITGDLIVPVGVTLIIEPGVTVYFSQGAGIDIAGRLVAQGTSTQRITLTRAPGVTGTWDGLQFNSTQQDNRLAFVDMSYGEGRGHSIGANTSKLWIDNTIWTNSLDTIIELQNPSLRVTGSVFPSVSLGETIHGSAPLGTTYLILDGNTFGVNVSGDDVVDIGPSDGDANPKVLVLNNVFLGGGDDGLDLDAVDALIENNVFMNFHKNTTRNTSSNAVSTGSAGGTSNQSDLIVRRNLFINNDHALLLKEGGFATSEHNVYYNTGTDTLSPGVVQLTEIAGGEKAKGRGGTFTGDIFWQNSALFVNDRPPQTKVVNQSVVPASDVSLGMGNLAIDPQFLDIAGQDFHLKPTSGAIGGGPGGTDMGAYPDATHAGIVINEVLAVNVQSYNQAGAYPDIVELYNRGTTTVDMGGMRITDDPLQPNKFVFAPSTQIDPGEYLTLFADSAVTAGIHLGFALDSEGDALYLYKGAADGGELVDSIAFGLQIADYSIGRVGANSHWTLTQPTIGALNTAQPLGDPSALQINEWFASGNIHLSHDFVELFNPNMSPVALRGLYITDDPGAQPVRSAFAPLSYIASQGYTALIADGDVGAGADHVDFQLASGAGRIALFQGTQTLVGDYNEDGSVDTADYVIWRKANGQFVPGGSSGDANDDGTVDQADYSLWRANFGHSIDDPGVRTDSAVPYWSVPGLKLIDFVTYMPQTTDYSQGRSPDGAATFEYFTLPTPGVANATATNPNVALPLAILSGLRITEVMYNPLGGTDYEFVELTNVGPSALDLAGVRIGGGIEFTFPSVALSAGDFIVIVNNLSAFQSRYGAGLNVAGEFVGNLDNSGEVITLELAEPYDAAVLRFAYDDDGLAGWPTSPDGNGPSLEVIDPQGDYPSPVNWQASANANGSPGAAGAASAALVAESYAGSAVLGETEGGIVQSAIAPQGRKSLYSTFAGTKSDDDLLILALNTLAIDIAAASNQSVMRRSLKKDEPVDNAFAEFPEVVMKPSACGPRTRLDCC